MWEYSFLGLNMCGGGGGGGRWDALGLYEERGVIFLWGMVQ